MPSREGSPAEAWAQHRHFSLPGGRWAGLGPLSAASACVGQVLQGAPGHLAAALSWEPLSARPAPWPPRPHTPGDQGAQERVGMGGWS